MAKKPKFYVVWQGRNPGVYRTWDACQHEISGFSAAKYKSFPTLAAAEKAFGQNANLHWGVKAPGIGGKKATPTVDPDDYSSLGVDTSAWCVDAACQGNPGILEYQGMDLASGTSLFHMGPYPEGTVNIGEFLAIVHALALLKHGNDGKTKIYSDSRIAIGWIGQKKCKTKLPKSAENARLFEHIQRAEKWLTTQTYTNPILKWETKRWGENPADFGRK